MLVLREVTFLTKTDHQKTVEDFEKTFDIETCYHDLSESMQKFNLSNSVIPIGTQFLEVMFTLREDTPAGKQLRRRGGDCGYMIVAQVDSKEEYENIRARALAMGIRINWEFHNYTTDHLQLHPADTGGAFFMVDWDSKNELEGNFDVAGGTAWKSHVKTELATAITAAEFQSDDPKKVAVCWSGFLNIPYSPVGENRYEIAVEGAVFRFVPAADEMGAGLSGFDVRGKDVDKVKKNAEARGLEVKGDCINICRTRVRLVE